MVIVSNLQACCHVSRYVYILKTSGSSIFELMLGHIGDECWLVENWE